MKWFRETLSKNRTFVLAFLATGLFYMAEGRQSAYAQQVDEQRESRRKEISEFLDIPIERLRPDHESLFDALEKLSVEDKEAGHKRLQEVLRKHEEQLAANPYLPQIEEVKREHAIYRIEGMIQDLMQLTEPRGGQALPEAAQRALLRNLHHGLKALPELPPLPAGSPAKARAKHAEMQARLGRLFDSVRPIVASASRGRAPSEKALATIAQEVEQLRLLQAVETKRPSREPRFADRPLPLRRVEKKARTLEVSALDAAKAAAPSPATASAASPPVEKVSKAGIAPEIVELAASLGSSPARIFAWVHDNVDFDPKWGAFKGPLGTMWEKSGTSWDQAWLLKELLQAAGVDARFEWGEVQISPELLTNLTGLEDPFRAGDLLTTAGVPIVLLTQGSQVVAARMSHVWVKAFIDYVPNRGVTPGPGETWIRMDPSFKRFDYAPGIQIHDDVPFSLASYLESATPLSPRRSYENVLWDFIRANNINCTTLEQLKPKGSVIQESFPFVPGTLRAKVLAVDGESSNEPVGFEQGLKIDVRKAAGELLLTWETTLPELYGQRVEILYRGATADDQATLDSHGGVFETPPFLVDLRPAVQVGGIVVAAGSAVGSAEDVEISVTLTPVNGAADVLVHDGLAGEPSVLVVDFNRLPAELIERHRSELAAALAAGDDAAVEAASRQMLGATYMRNLGRDLEDIAGWTWHRMVRLVTEGLVTQTGKVTVAADGTPIGFTRDATFLDVATMTLGLFHSEGGSEFVRPTLEALGAQGSFLEGEVFAEVLERQGIAATSALTEARRQGQSLTLVDGSNVETVLAAVDLGGDVEAAVRQAVSRGRIAWVPESPLSVNLWQGVGYVLEDPATGAAAYLISGGFAGGLDTGGILDILKDVFGNEGWLDNGFLGLLTELIEQILGSGGSGDPPGPNTNHGDPINLATGNMWRTENDLLIQARGLPIVWNRTYNSRSDYNGPLGYGWTFQYGQHLEAQGDGSILYRESDGTEHLFTPDGAGGFVHPPGKHLTLSPQGSSFEMVAKDGTVSVFSSAGALTQVTDRYGSTVTLSYDAGGNLTSVTDASGRPALTVTTVAGKITEVTDLAGRRVLYSYTGDDLTTVVDTANETWTMSYDSFHNLTARTNPLAESDAFAYDTFDRCIEHVDPLGNSERFSYAHGGQRTVVTDRRGQDHFFEFDDEGRAVLEVDPLGNPTRSTWDADNNRASTTDARGGETLRTYDGSGNLLTVEDDLGNTTTRTYDPQFNQVLTVTDGKDHTITNTYDSNGSLQTREQETAGEVVTESYVFDSFGQPLEYRDKNDDMLTIAWDPVKGSVESMNGFAGDVFDFTTDELGQIEKVDLPDTRSIQYGRDGRDRVTSLIDPYGNPNGIGYDAAGRQTSATTPLGTSTIEYDPAGRPIASTDRAGGTIHSEYDPEGNVIARTDTRGNRTVMIYDPLGRVTATIDPLGHVWTFGHCADVITGGASSCGLDGCAATPNTSGVCDLTDPLGNTTRRKLDALGRVVEITDPLGNTTFFEYDEIGRRTAVTNARGHTTSFEYDEEGRLSAVVQADDGRTEYTYDGNGNVVSIKDAETHEWPRVYGANSIRESEADPLGHTYTYLHDTLGRQTDLGSPNGPTTSFSYDGARLTAINHPGGFTETFAYDSLGRRTGMSSPEVSIVSQYDELNRLVHQTNETVGRALDYTYDGDGNVLEIRSEDFTVTRVYDAAGRLVEQEDSRVGTYRYAYDAANRLIRRTYPNAVVTEIGYDAASRLTSLATRDPSGTILDGYTYTYDEVGNRTSMTELDSGVVHTYEYDKVDRLTRWDRSDGHFEIYTYDLTGNRETLQDPSGTTEFTYDIANRLVSAERGGADPATVLYEWDDAGNLTLKNVDGVITEYGYDALNRLVAVDGPSGHNSYGYDPLGIRVRSTAGGVSERALYAFEDLAALYDESGGLTTYFSHGPAIDEPSAQLGAGGVEFLHRDALGSVTAVSSPQAELLGRVRYGAFGGVDSSSGTGSRYGYTSRELDDTGLMYYRTRYYDPQLARFTTADTYAGQIEEPRSLNRYAYVWNNPINSTDSWGTNPDRCPEGDWLSMGITSPSVFWYVIGWEFTRAWYQCSSTGVWFKGETLAWLFGWGFDFGFSGNVGVVWNAFSKGDIESFFLGVDIGFPAGLGFGLWGSQATTLYFSYGLSFGFHFGGGISWTDALVQEVPPILQP